MPTTAWEYKVVSDQTFTALPDDVAMSEELTHLGVDRWELVTVRAEGTGPPYQGGFWVFKRSIG